MKLFWRNRSGGYDDDRLAAVVFAKTAALDASAALALPGAEKTVLAVGYASAKTASRPLRVLDFGGACGLHHKAASAALPMTAVKWAVVETAVMARRAAVLSRDDLSFFDDIDEALRWLGGVDLVHASGALQYCDDPERQLRRLAGVDAPVMLLSRMVLREGPAVSDLQRSMLSENGPGPMPPGLADGEVTHVATSMSRDVLFAVQASYELLLEYPDAYPAFLFVARRR